MAATKETTLQSLADFLGQQIERLNLLKRFDVVMNGFEDGLHEESGVHGEYVRFVDLEKIVSDMRATHDNAEFDLATPIPLTADEIQSILEYATRSKSE